MFTKAKLNYSSKLQVQTEDFKGLRSICDAE